MAVAELEMQQGALNVLVVDDGPLGAALRGQGFGTVEAGDGMRALMLSSGPGIDAVVLDAGAPLLDGLEVCRRLRAAGNDVPVLMLGAGAGVLDRVAGLEAGADDYLVRPFAVMELKARLRAITRRHRAFSAPSELTYAGVRVDRATHRAWRGERELQLTRTEFLLLECLLESAEHVLERSRLWLRVWGYDAGDESNSLGVYIGYLRRKLEAGGEPRLIHTVRYVGYVLRDERAR